jgi:hypothetical protein
MIMIETESISGDFMTLFRGRGDVYGSWDGGCIRKPLNDETFWNHLHGHELVGVYPLVPINGEYRCVWGCSDIDIDDLDAARNLETAFMLKGIKAWVEKTRKGYHIWVFSTKSVTAATMRRAFLAAHQVIDYPPTEVNPKQENPNGGFGNYVRLPYPSALDFDSERVETRFRYILDDEDKQMSLQQFVPIALESRATPEQLETIASLWVPPPSREIRFTETDLDTQTVLNKLNGLCFTIWRDGPTPGSDRSLTMYRLACKARDIGLVPEEVVVLIKSADLRWGKFYTRIDPDKEIFRLVSTVFGAQK